MALGVARERFAQEAGVSVKTVKSYEEDARPSMRTGRLIEEALDRLESPDSMAGEDSAKRRIIDAVIGDATGELLVRVLPDGTRVIALIPNGAPVPTSAQLDKLLRQVRRP